MIYKFGVYEFDDETKELRKNGRAAALEPQPAKALARLLSRAGEVVSREELRDAIWGSTHVDVDRGIAYCLSQVRASLGDAAENPRFVQTIPKRGFKFIAPVAAAALIEPDAPAELNAPDSSLRLVLGGLAVFGTLIVALFAVLVWDSSRPSGNGMVIAVSVFDNETGNAQYDRPVAGLSDLVVERLTRLDPRIAVIGNAAILRQPRNIRNLKVIAANVKADYVLLGQLQQGESGLRFITHFIRLKDEAHLKANRLSGIDPSLAGLEAAVVAEFERATRQFVLGNSAN